MPKSGKVVWITGLSGAGKTTVSRLVAARLRSDGIKPVMLDGDVLRRSLPDSRGFNERSRLELAKYYGRLAAEFATQDHVVLCATVSMFHAVRAWNRANLPGYLEVWLHVPLDVLVERDAKGVYRVSELAVGMGIKPELPRAPDLVIDNYAPVTSEMAAAIVYESLVEAR